MKNMYPLAYFGLFKSAMLAKGRDNELFGEVEGSSRVEELLLQIRSLYKLDELEEMVQCLYATEKEREVMDNPEEHHHLTRVHASRSIAKHARILYQIKQQRKIEQDFRDKLAWVPGDSLPAADATGDNSYPKYITEKLRQCESFVDVKMLAEEVEAEYLDLLQSFDVEGTFPDTPTPRMRLLEEVLDVLGALWGEYSGRSAAMEPPAGERYDYSNFV